MSNFTHISALPFELFLSLNVVVCTLIPRNLNRIARRLLANTKAISFQKFGSGIKLYTNDNMSH